MLLCLVVVPGDGVQVWYGRADWAAKLSVALEKEDDIDWFNPQVRACMCACVHVWALFVSPE